MRRILPLAFIVFVAPAQAGELLDGFRRALANDPSYQAARAELEANLIESEKANRAYWPEVGFKYGERSEIQGSQTTVQIAQPLLDDEHPGRADHEEDDGIAVEAVTDALDQRQP